MAKFLVVLAAVFVGALGVPASKIDSSLNWRIVGGSDAPESAYPYQISMRYSGSHGCGGSIISPRTILTAAHCVDGMSASSLTVVVGSTKLNEGGVSYAVKSIKAHENYNLLLIRNDVALLILETPIEYSDNVAPVELETSDVGAGAKAVLSGWGTINYPGNGSFGEIPNNLQTIDLLTISVADCKSRHSIIPGVTANQVCTLTQRGEGACHGDSGGPLVSNGKQIGIVSWGRPCAIGYPDVFTRVSSYIDWIHANAE